MEKLLKQAQELVASLQEAKSEVVRNKDMLENELSKANKLMNELAQKKADLDAKEASLNGLAAPHIALEEAKKIQAENKEALDAINTAHKAFIKDRAEFNSKVAKEKVEFDVQKDVLAKELETLKADRKQLAEKEKTYKDDILNNLKAVK